MTEKRNIICIPNIMFGTVLLIQVQRPFQIGYMPEIGAEGSHTGQVSRPNRYNGVVSYLVDPFNTVCASVPSSLS
jgi:hypothetical protein